MKSVCIVTSGHFCTNPRVWKEADALSSKYEVTVIGVRYDVRQSLLDDDMLRSRCWTYLAAMDIRPLSLGRQVLRQCARLRTRIARHRVRKGFYDPEALGFGVRRLARAARQRRADLTIVHLEPGLWVGKELQARGSRVGVDIEDWYSTNDLQRSDTHPRREFLRLLEIEVLQNAVHSTTTSKALSERLAEVYKCPKPTVIYNSVPRIHDCAQLTTAAAPLVFLWFSQTLGPNRGLEDLFKALPELQGNWMCDLMAAIPKQAEAWLQAGIPSHLRSRVNTKPVVPPDELSRAVAKYDVGLALEIPSCPNKDLTASNKIFQYLQSGMFVCATATAGQREALGLVPGSGILYPSGNAHELATQLNGLIKSTSEVRRRRQALFDEANKRLAYETQVSSLLASVERGLK